MEEILMGESPVQDQEVTVTPELEKETPDALSDNKDDVLRKTFTQEEVDAFVSKRLSREQRKWEREFKALSSEKKVVSSDSFSPEQFESSESYIQAVIEAKAQEIISKRDQDKHQKEMIDAHAAREKKARQKFEDYDRVARDESVPISNYMADAMISSEIGPEIAYYLGSNIEEADRISELSPLLQIKEIGKLEAKLMAEPVVKKVSSAPEPIAPLTPRSTTRSYDTTDPRSISTMSVSDWINAERKRQMKKMESTRR